jgi:hypothetical protein
MVVYNPAKREIDIKIVYYGPALCGKTTNVQSVHKIMNPQQRGELVSLATKDDRTLFFDFLPIELDSIKGFKTHFHIYTVPGQVMYNLTRRAVLTGADGVVFVADSQVDKMDENIESLNDLKDNLGYYKKDLESFPFVIQYNKRDLDNVVSVKELEEKLNATMVPSFAASAVNGEGVMETLTMCCRLVLKKITDKTGAQREVGVVKKKKIKESEKEKIEAAISELPDLKLVASNEAHEAAPVAQQPLQEEKDEHVAQAGQEEETSDEMEGSVDQYSQYLERATDTLDHAEGEKGEQLGEEKPLMDKVQEMGGQDEALKIEEKIALEVETPISVVNEIEEESVAAPSDSLVDEAVSQDTLDEGMKRTCPRCSLEFKLTVKKCPICKVSLMPEEEAETGELEVQPEVPKVTEEAAEEVPEVAEEIAAVAGEAPEMAGEISGVEEEMPEIHGIAGISGDEKGLEILACGQPEKTSSTAFKVPLTIRIEKSDQEFMVNLSINFEDFVLKSKD